MIRFIFFASLMILLSLKSQAQNIPDSIIDRQHSGPVVETRVFRVVEQMPEYVGGEEAMMKFIQNSIRYPEDAMEIGIQGRVIVSFIIDENGKLDSITVKRTVWPSIDQEAIRMAKLTAGKWKPGKQQGRAVRVTFMLPISFKLTGGDFTLLNNPSITDGDEVKANKAFQRKNYTKAIASYKLVCNADENNIFARHNLGLSYYLSGDTEAAKTNWLLLRGKGCHISDLMLQKYCGNPK